MFLRPIKSPSLPPIGVIIDKPSAENIENKPTYPIAFTLSNIGDVSVAKTSPYIATESIMHMQPACTHFLLFSGSGIATCVFCASAIFLLLVILYYYARFKSR